MSRVQRNAVKSRARFAGYVLSLLLVVVETGALAHELEHQLQKPDAPCAQCLFANHLGKTPITLPHVSSTGAPERHARPVSIPAPRRHEITAYAVRAPPADSEI